MSAKDYALFSSRKYSYSHTQCALDSIDAHLIKYCLLDLYECLFSSRWIYVHTYVRVCIATELFQINLLM